MSKDLIVRRGGDRKDYLEIHFYHQGDIFVFVKGVNRQGKESEAQVEFCTPMGGGYHPRTIATLWNLAKAIQEDNEDPESPVKYTQVII